MNLYTSKDLTRTNMKFQDAAANLLSITCPSVSAFLQQEFNEGAFKTKADLPSSRKHQVCDSCGTMAKLQDTTRVGKLIETKCYNCGCNAKTVVTLYKRLTTDSKLRLTPLNGLNSGKRQTRSKSQAQRKQQSSLQAMLAKSKSLEASKSSFGLNLLDLMKS